MFDNTLFDKNLFDRQEAAVSSDFDIFSYGNTIADFDITYNLEISLSGNSGGIAGVDAEEVLTIQFPTPLVISITATSKVELFRFGNTDISFIYLDDIQLAPGEEITIDTDLLIVLFGDTHDVSSITADSVFFELGPGANDLIFYPEYDNYPDLYTEPSGNELDISIIWQNRWL